jgi:hypothetical protein
MREKERLRIEIVIKPHEPHNLCIRKTTNKMAETIYLKTVLTGLNLVTKKKMMKGTFWMILV